MAANYVWLSTAMKDPRQLRPFTNDLADTVEKRDLAIGLIKRNNAGEPLGPEAFPKTIWGAADRGARTFGKLPEIFFGFGYWTVSERCAEVLRRFDLGAGALYPVKVFQKDKVTPIGDHAWFCLNFGNVKSALTAEQSKELRPFPGGRWTAWSTIPDNAVAVSAVALRGPDIWVDPQFNESLFLSAALGEALRKAKCASGWGLRKCRVIES